MSSMNSHGESEDLQPVHVLFFPFMASGHMPPLVDLAKLLASRGVRATLLTTPGNAPADLPPSIHLYLIPFPSAAVGLPVGIENIAHLPIHQHPNFIAGVSMLRDDFRVALADLRPDAVVADWLLPFAAPVADEFCIPRFTFHGFSNIALCGQVSHFCQPLPPPSSAASGAEEELTFVVPNLPRRIEMLRSQMEDLNAVPAEAVKFIEEIREWEMRSYGVVVNSFYELETEFADHVRQVIGRRTWHVGPVASYDPKPAEEAHECLEWLDESEEPVLYVCFGSMGSFTAAQLRELALGLKACGHPFIWAIRDAADVQQWWPDGDSERREEKRYLILKGWAPQTAILNHPAVGGFVTHCGWNSCLEAISAAVPMATWPIFADQFFNEKLITEVLEIGVPVGATHCSLIPERRPLIAAAQIEKALRRLMDDGGEEAKSMRTKVRELALMAKKATEEGGSSYDDVDKLVSDLRDLKENGMQQH
ncbi:scopoletin glucosyltransferase-like [Curcuma longa]|uniref:scopoletin glucosyltransferase-like n=1 Tax=Curcuma longa TaxID=136217 RepID=UPI003D9EFA5A